MKALILAAGLGSRLAPITNDIPKSLVPVNGKPILMKQIDNLHENGITDITIISGYKAEILENKIHAFFPEINIIESKEYAVTNNMFSAYMGKNAVSGDSFLMMNADVFFDSTVISALLNTDDPNAIVVDVGRYIEESMKVVENDGRITEISKKILPENATGSSIDVYKFSENAGNKFFEKCSEYINAGDVKKWSEVALNDILETVDFKVCPLIGRWYEIDNHEDLAEAEKLFND